MNSYSLNNDSGDGRQEASFQKLSQSIASNLQKIHQNGKKYIRFYFEHKFI